MNGLWKISLARFDRDREAIMRAGNVYQLANGYMGYRGTLDEFGTEQFVGITLAGLYDRVGSAWREPVNAPNGGFAQVLVNGTKVSVLSTRIVSHKQILDLANAVFRRITTFSVRGRKVTVTSARFLSASNPHLGGIRLDITCDQAAELEIETGIDYDVWDLNGPHLRQFAGKNRDGILSVTGVTNETGKSVAVAEAITMAEGVGRVVVRDQKNLHRIRLRAEAGRTYTLEKFFAVYTGNDGVRSPVEAAVACVRAAKLQTYAGCLADHNAEWKRKWAQSDVVIEGDDAAQLALRYSIFQLLQVAPLARSAHSIPARALSGQVYKGAIFWDTELFMFPFFLFSDPETARELIRYRIKTLAGARRKARTESVGYRGAFYAWESQETGDEACSYFNIGDPITGRELRTYFRDKQIHISGAIAIASWKYFKVTGDDSLLLGGGAEVILECARFYYSYACFRPDKQRYEIWDVTGPDEYHERVNNNAFTNLVVKATFEIAGETVKYLRRKHPAKLKALIRRLGIAAELPQFASMAQRLYVPPPDKRTGVIEQFDDYFRLEDASVATVKARKIHPNEYLGGGQGVATATQVIKQADVVMMLNLFREHFSRKVKKANWEFYEPRTEHGSSLSACAYAMVAAEFGRLDAAYKYFLETAQVDLAARYKLYAGTTFIGGSHPAANGGAWMTAVFGFGGLQASATQVTIEPRLYRKWRRLAFGVFHRHDRFEIQITRKCIEVRASGTNRASHEFVLAGRKRKIAPGVAVAVSY
ncbi:MAG TPA: hypothetical protein VL527_05035 [Dongiaceae bacterium]|jgi:kojibiose phosphorylase|nr:hypothetical protein [Dongiaceae bacterium]